MPLEIERPFAEPWQAQLHALTVALHEAGLFTWTEWTEALSLRLHSDVAEADGSNYYALWLEAFIELLDARGLAAADHVRDVAASWQRAAEATPHGTPIELTNDPRSGA